MVDVSLSVATYLQNAGFGTLGTDIFVGEIPDETSGIWVVRSGGQPNRYVPIEETVVDIYCKDIKSEVCVQKLESIKRDIHRQHTLTINTSFVYTFLIIGDIIDVQRDPEYEKVYKITLQAVHRDTTLIS
jgi:hypothetical protein